MTAADIAGHAGALALESTLILGIAWTIVVRSARRSAEERHLVLVAALAGLLLATPATVLLPKTPVPFTSVADGWGRRATEAVVSVLEREGPQRAAADVAGADAAGTDGGRSSEHALQAAPASTAAPAARTSRRAVRAAAAWLYLAVAISILAYFAIGWLRVALRLRALRPDTTLETCALVRGLAGELGLRSAPRLRCGVADRTPWSWGVVRPVVVLPVEFETWPAHDRRAALVHELSHVKRLDTFSTMLAQLCCALYWCQPLVWIAAARLRREAEQACDDRVLLSGASPSAYAMQLLRLAKAIYRDRRQASPVPAMAGTFVSRRIESVLEQRTRRTTVNVYKITVTLAVTLLVAAPVATLESQPAGPADEAELGRTIDSLLDASRTDEARGTLVRWISDHESCEVCTRGLEHASPELAALVLDAFADVEARAQRNRDGRLLVRLARLCHASDDESAQDLGIYYLTRAESLGGVDDDSKLFTVQYFSDLGQYAVAEAFAEKLQEDPASSYYHSDVTQGWIKYLENMQSRMSSISTRLVNGDAAASQAEYVPIYKPAPVYPKDAMQQHLEGYAITEYTITPEGTIADARIVESSSSVFNEPTLESVARYRYMPRLTGGTAVSAAGVQTLIRFKLEN